MSSDYEKARELNIRRNEEFLKNIGLDKLHQVIRSSTVAKKSSSAQQRGDTEVNGNRKKRLRSGEIMEQPPPRRSRRLQYPAKKMEEKKESEEDFLFLNDGEVATAVSREKRRAWQHQEDTEYPDKIGAQQLLDYIMKANVEHYELADNAGAIKCCDRINSMSTAGLALRLRRIKQTNKMIIFYYGLKLAGLTDLASQAKVVLENQHKVKIK